LLLIWVGVFVTLVALRSPSPETAEAQQVATA